MKICLNILLALLIVAAKFSALARDSVYKCKSASESGVPLGGNQIIIQTAGTIRQIEGRTYFMLNGNVFQDAVVEVFKIKADENKDLEENAWRAVKNKKRRTAI